MPGPSEEQPPKAVQQVMSPSAPCGLPNGRATGGELHQSDVVENEEQFQGEAGAGSDAAQQQEANVRTGGLGLSNLHAMEADVPRIAAETTTGAVQAGSGNNTLTTLDLGGRSTAGSTGAVHKAEAGFDRHTVHMAVAAPKGKAASTWLPGVEPPKWLQRLGSFLNVPGPGSYQVDFPPSPFPGATPPYTPPPPGGPTFRLRSPGRPKAIPPAPTPPSSSSVPAEAIQAEVQRQLGGILGQLKEYSDRNERLQAELEDTRATLRSLQSGDGGGQEGERLGQGRLLGDLATARLDPGLLEGTTIPTMQLQQPQPDPRLPEGFPAFLQPAPVLPVPSKGITGGNARAEVQGGHGANSAAYQGDVFQEGDQQAGLQGATGLLRSWWDSRQREPTPPPRPAPADGRDSPVLDALTRGVQQLQELQAHLKPQQALPQKR